MEIYPEEYAGRCSAEKRKVVAKWLEKEGFDAFLVSATDSVCWLFNIRGSDVEFSPLVIAYGLVKSDGSAALFVDPAKLSDDLARHLGKGVDIVPYDALPDALAKLKGKISTVAYDRDTGSRWLADNIAAAGLDAEEVQRIWLVGYGLEHLAVDVLRLGESPCAVMTDAHLHRFLDGDLTDLHGSRRVLVTIGRPFRVIATIR